MTQFIRTTTDARINAAHVIAMTPHQPDEHGFFDHLEARTVDGQTHLVDVHDAPQPGVLIPAAPGVVMLRVVVVPDDELHEVEQSPVIGWQDDGHEAFPIPAVHSMRRAQDDTAETRAQRVALMDTHSGRCWSNLIGHWTTRDECVAHLVADARRALATIKRDKGA
jgi:hypothetical protein